jgi:hypothetical protein
VKPQLIKLVSHLYAVSFVLAFGTFAMLNNPWGY